MFYESPWTVQPPPWTPLDTRNPYFEDLISFVVPGWSLSNRVPNNPHAVSSPGGYQAELTEDGYATGSVSTSSNQTNAQLEVGEFGSGLGLTTEAIYTVIWIATPKPRSAASGNSVVSSSCVPTTSQGIGCIQSNTVDYRFSWGFSYTTAARMPTAWCLRRTTTGGAFSTRVLDRDGVLLSGSGTQTSAGSRPRVFTTETTHAVATWLRILSDEEVFNFVRNPWQVFEPRKVGFDFSAAPTFPTLSAATAAYIAQTTARPRVTITVP